MNRTEALHILGLGEDATAEDIKVAYKETVQILHPDKFATNKKLQERATEQFKNLQEAYEYLSSGKGSRKSSSAGKASSAGSSGHSASHTEARMAGVAAARTQLVAQRDAAYDERKNALVMAGIGAAVALFAGRRPYGILGIVAAIAGTAAIWGIVQAISAHKTISTLTEHIDELNREERRLAMTL